MGSPVVPSRAASKDIPEISALAMLRIFLLALLPILIAGAPLGHEHEDGKCCYQKKYPDATYTLAQEGSSETSKYGCDTEVGCVYKKEGTEELYCFKLGGAQAPDCIKMNPNGDQAE